MKINTLKTILYLRTDICSQELFVGGSVAHTLGVIKGFQNLGSTIVCASTAMPTVLKNAHLTYFQKLEVWPVFCFLRWKLGYLRWRLDCIFSNLFFPLQLRSIFKNYAIDIIYQRYSLLNCVGVILSTWKKIPLILEYNGSEVWQFDKLAPCAWFKFNFLAKHIELLNLRHANYIIVVSEALKDDLVAQGINEKKILVNPNGVDIEIFNPEKLINERENIRQQLQIQDKFVFGFIGTFSFWHGIELLAAMIPAVVQQKPNAHFILIGDGILKDFLKHELEKHAITDKQVTFTGPVPQHTAKNYLAACDAFLSPTQPNADGTRFFGSPTKIFEYLSMGKPVIASDLEQLTNLIEPAFTIHDLSQDNLCATNQIGFLIPPKNIDGFITASCRLMELDKPIQLKIGINARNKAISNYTWNEHVHKIQKFIQ